MVIYVLDDEKYNCMLMKDVIEEFYPEAQVATYYTKREFMEAFDAKACDIAFLDVMLGDGVGYDLVEYVKKNGKTKAIMASAMGRKALAESAALADGYINKPYSIAHIRDEIEKALGRGER